MWDKYSRVISVFILGWMLSACDSKSSSATGATEAPKSEASLTILPSSPELGATSTQVSEITMIDVLSVYHGAFMVGVDPVSALSGSQLLTEQINYGDYYVLTPNGQAYSEVLIQLAELAEFKVFRLIGPTNPDNAPKRVEIALSDAQDGSFQTVVSADLTYSPDRVIGNAFDVSLPLSLPQSGRFVRLRMFDSLNNHLDQRGHAIASIMGMGQFVTPPQLPELNGVYRLQGSFGHAPSGLFFMSLSETSAGIEGCVFSADQSLLDAPITPSKYYYQLKGAEFKDGGLMIVRSGTTPEDEANGILSFSSSAELIHSAFFIEGHDPKLYGGVSRASGQRIATEPIVCQPS